MWSAFLAAVASATLSSAAENPNILLILADDLGYGDLSCYGHPTSLTPNIDLLASKGTKFTSIYAASPVCSPSRAGLLTGRYQTRSGVWPGVFNALSTGGLPLSELTIAELLKSNGLDYATGIIGKWHLGVGGQNGTYLPTRQGFDFWTGIPYSHDMPVPPVCWPGNLPCYPDTPLDPWADPLVDSYPLTAFNDSVNAPRDEDFAVRSDDDNKENRFSPRKWSHKDRDLEWWHSPERLDELYIEGSGDTPIPLYLQEEIVQQPANLTEIPPYYVGNAKQFMLNATAAQKPFFLYLPFHETHHPQFSSVDYFNTSQRGQFGDALRELDHMVGELMVFLEDQKLTENTLVLFFSDNGGALKIQGGGDNGPLKCGKGTTWEGGQRVPGIAYWPGKVPAGRTTRQLGSLLDVMPTLADLLDVPLPGDRTYDGLSMLDWLFGNGPSKRRTFWYWPPRPNPNVSHWWTKGLEAVRTDQFKLRWMAGGGVCENDYADRDCRHNNTHYLLDRPMLANLYHDPGEKVNLMTLGDNYYDPIIKGLNETFVAFLDQEDLFGDSMINGQSSQEAEPCCNWGCADWPDCCQCNEMETLSRVTERFWRSH